MRKYVFIFLIMLLVLVSALVITLIATGHVDEAMRIVEGVGGGMLILVLSLPMVLLLL